jgi:hypothetical protein
VQIGFGSVQDRIAVALGCDPASRHSIVAGTLENTPTEVHGYWLQMLVAIGIATLGLVLGSSAVIIGAMLIAPLMGPSLALGMGLSVGSPFLVLRAIVPARRTRRRRNVLRLPVAGA